MRTCHGDILLRLSLRRQTHLVYPSPSGEEYKQTVKGEGGEGPGNIKEMRERGEGGRTDDHPVSNAGGGGAVPSFTRVRVVRESFAVPLPPRDGLNLVMGGAQAAQR